MIPDTVLGSLFSDLKDQITQVETFETKAKAMSRYYKILFSDNAYEIHVIHKLLIEPENEQKDFSILLEPMFKISETHQPSKNPLIRRTSIVNVIVEPIGYTVKSENIITAKKLQKLIDDLFEMPREKPTLPQGCLVRVRKNSSGHQ